MLTETEKGTDAALSVGTATASAGSVVYGELPAIELADGTAVSFPVVIAAGSRPGPTVYLGAAIHGDEVCGIETVHRLIGSLDLSTLAGTVVSIPVQNPVAMAGQHRFPLLLSSKSPMDQLPGDPWECFPGDHNGNSLQRMAATLWDVMVRADVVIDMHTPTTGGRYQPFVFLPPQSAGSAAKKAMEIANAFGPNFILDTESGVYVMPGTPHVELAKRNIPAIGIEIGEGGRIEPEVADDAVGGLTNILIHLGMLGGEPEPRPQPTVMSSMTAVRCSRGGLLHPQVPLGTLVREGDLLATVTDSHGRLAEEIRAPHEGALLRSTTFATVAAGERIAQLAVPK